MRYPDDFDDLVIINRADYDGLSRDEQIAVCIHKLEAQVNNGGFHQFFWNSSGEYVRETLDALASIRAPKTRSLLERAMLIAFPNGYPLDPAQHQVEFAEFDDVGDALEPLDREFFSYSEPLDHLVNEFLIRDT
jgi:hypothetical protein